MGDWQRIQSVFLATADLPPDTRESVLVSLCDGDLELQGEVESLLAADNYNAVTIHAAIQGMASTIVSMSVRIGERVGAYKIVREIGRGGMGSVYLALRDDEVYTKEVALKVVKQGMDTEEVLSRFRHERQILANLDHPYIARLYDGGSTDDGVPFFAMEYVEGSPVDRFCRDNGLDVRARCALFLHILEGIAYAHRNLVVHGDLKPANIFVTADGTPKLLDFGVAKLMGREHLETPMPDARAFTPGYASPEQVRGTAITTSTDIYSLGAVLYELLSGERAQPVDFDSATRLESAVSNVEALRPSLAAQGLPADLEDVVLMALRKEPELRYQSATAFADDMRRCLEGRPVMAREDSVSYRARRFVVRNRLEVALAAVTAVALLAGLVVSLAQTRHARAERSVADEQRQVAFRKSAEAETARASEARQRDRADEQRAVADEQRGLAEAQRGVAVQERDIAEVQKALADKRLKDILELADHTLFDVHDAIAELPGSIPARRKIVETTLSYLKTMEGSAGSDDKMREVLAAAYYKVAMIQGDARGASFQDFASAEQSLRHAQELLQPAYERNPNDYHILQRWIEVRSAQSDLIYPTGRAQEAIEINLELLPVAARLAKITPCPITCETQETAIEARLASQSLPLDSAVALAHASRSAELSRKLLIRYSSDQDLKQDLAVVTAIAAAANKNVGDLEGAGEFYRQSIEAREEMLRDHPGTAVIRRSLLVVCGNYATLLGVPWSQNLGRPAEARVYAARAVAIARELVSADPKDATARRDLGMSLGRSGMIDPGPGETGASLRQLEEASELIEPIVVANPKSAETARQLAEILEYRALRLFELDRTADAAAIYMKAMALLEPFLNLPASPVLAEYIANEEGLALLYASTGHPEAAVALADKAIAAAEKYAAMQPVSDLHVAELGAAWSTLALIRSKIGSTQLARQPAEKAIHIWDSIQKPGILTAFRRQIADTRALLDTQDAIAK